ncbi:hypothetical protein [Lacrimispora sp.]|uniref:hypothetical protein n=1 Tax=Lacrimispora sp. TaxID=2719234 RepID=UPI0034613BF8
MQQQEQGKVSEFHIFGSHVMNTTGNMGPEKAENKLNKAEKTKELFEMVDDYIEQA